jgi:hypothetical protein
MRLGRPCGSALLGLEEFGQHRFMEQLAARTQRSDFASIYLGHPVSAVGTGIAVRPPLRSEHARFAHSAPPLGV